MSYQTDSILYDHSITLDICSDVIVFLSSEENNGTEVTLWIQMELILDIRLRDFRCVQKTLIFGMIG